MKKLFLILKKLRAYKGLDILIDAAKIIKNKISNFKILSSG